MPICAHTPFFNVKLLYFEVHAAAFCRGVNIAHGHNSTSLLLFLLQQLFYFERVPQHKTFKSVNGDLALLCFFCLFVLGVFFPKLHSVV